MCDTGWHDDDVSLFYFSDDPPQIIEAQVSATVGDAKYLCGND